MNPQDTQKRVLAAHKLLLEQTTTREKIESIRTLIRGINPRIDKAFDSCSKALSDYAKLQKGEVIELTLENLPEQTEEEKKRKRALILFLKSWKDLRSEVERVKSEFENNQNNPNSNNLTSFAKITAFAKGPFGIITIGAIVMVGIFTFINSTKRSDVQGVTAPKNASKIQVIEYNGKKIPLSEVVVGAGLDCDSPHYHAKDHTAAKALDESIVPDPGACGYGKVSDVLILTQ